MPLGLFVPADEGSPIVKLLLFFAIFVAPAILKSIRESKQKRKEAEHRAAGGSSTAEPASASAKAETEAEAAQVGMPPGLPALPDGEPGGREQWERLLRGDTAEARETAPPPIPTATVPATRRRLLTESPPLTGGKPLTETPALTDARPIEAAMPHASYEGGPSYDEQVAPPARLSGDFRKFADPEGLASDREGGLGRRVGAQAAFLGGESFKGLADRTPVDTLEAREIGDRVKAVPRASPRRVLRARLSRETLLNSVLTAEILGPPVGLRALESGPTRPLGWS